ncbi:MAG TPA: MFS transporter [Thermoanaerobaculia bacterium]|jgi:MFS family permease|nr:MFS transporter [Thermoanaerobaculia bacterium]
MPSGPAAIDEGGSPESRQTVPGYSWYVLSVLTAIYVLNFLDRSLIYILFTPIKAETAFSDLQLALLGTTSFVIFYTLLGVPFGRLADRVSRTKLIAGGLAVWSLFSGLTGFAHGFWPLFLCRVMVGVGEATLGPAALSLLSDYFPPRMRATVQGIYSSGIAVGGGLAFFLGGWIGQSLGWRWAFYLLGFPGLVFAAIVFFVREPPRGRTEVAAVHYGREDWKILFRSVPLRYLYLGYALFGLASNNLGIWVPSFFIRVHGMSLALVGAAAGILSIVVGVPVTVYGGYLADRFRRMGKGGRMKLCAWAALASIPLWLGLLFSHQVGVLIFLNVFLFGLALMWVAPAAADLHEIAGPHLRGLGIGIFFSAVNLVAYGIGSPLIGKLNDILGVAAHPEQMRLSLLVCPAACLLAALLLWLGSRARMADTGA